MSSTLGRGETRVSPHGLQTRASSRRAGRGRRGRWRAGRRFRSPVFAQHGPEVDYVPARRARRSATRCRTSVPGRAGGRRRERRRHASSRSSCRRPRGRSRPRRWWARRSGPDARRPGPVIAVQACAAATSRVKSVPQPVVPVLGGLVDRLQPLVGGEREEGGQGQAGVPGGHGQPQILHGVAERGRLDAGQRAGLRQGTRSWRDRQGGRQGRRAGGLRRRPKQAPG